MEHPQAVPWLPPTALTNITTQRPRSSRSSQICGPYLKFCQVTLTMRTQDSEPRLIRPSPGSGKRSKIKIKPAYELRGNSLSSPKNIPFHLQMGACWAVCVCGGGKLVEEGVLGAGWVGRLKIETGNSNCRTHSHPAGCPRPTNTPAVHEYRRRTGERKGVQEKALNWI